MNGFDPLSLRSAFGSFPTGVTVVTTRDGDGNLFGFTANSFSSVSLDPPLLLVCPGRFLSSFGKFEACEHFAVSVLAEGQEDISNLFASYKGDRFEKVAWEPDTQNIPLIKGSAARFSCQRRESIPAGDHVVLLGEILDFDCSGARGLGYASGKYFRLDLERQAATAPPSGTRGVVGAIIEQNGEILLEQTPEGLRPPQYDLNGRNRVRDALSENLAKAGIKAELDRAYSMFDERASGIHYTYFLAHALPQSRPANARFHDIKSLATQQFVSQAHATMLKRFALEHETRDFTLYIGDESDGEIHTLDKRS